MRPLTRKRLALSIASLLAALVAAELFCRLAAPPRPCLRFEQDLGEFKNYKLPDAIATVESDPELFWRLTPSLTMPTNTWPFFGLISNAQGLREDHVIMTGKEAHDIRILFLGDSCTFGYGVPYDKTFVEITESFLQAKDPDTSIECINAGVPGYTLFQGWRYLDTEGLKHKPQIVVLNFGWNDASIWDNHSDEQHYNAMKALSPPGVLGKSRLCSLLWKVITPPMEPGGPTPRERRPRVTAGEFAALLKKVKYLAGKHNAKLLVIAWPGRGNILPDLSPGFRSERQTEMIRFGREHPTPDGTTSTLDLVPLTQKLVATHGTEAVFLDLCHVTPLGHEAIAQAIAARISGMVEATDR